MMDYNKRKRQKTEHGTNRRSTETLEDRLVVKLPFSENLKQSSRLGETIHDGRENMIEDDEKKKTKQIRIAKYNIRNGWKGKLEGDLRALEKMNIDIVFLEETKITNDCYTKNCFGFEVIATAAESIFPGWYCVGLSSFGLLDHQDNKPV
jgi:hypothetical protein